MKGGATTSAGTDSYTFAGWLFAELAMVMMVIMLGSAVPGKAPLPIGASTATGTAKASPQATPTPSSTPKTMKVGIDANAVRLEVTMRHPADAESARRFLEQVARDGRPPGLILLFGTPFTRGTDLGGTAVAHNLIEQLTILDARIGGTIVVKSYENRSKTAPRGLVLADVYYLVEVAGP